MALEEIYKNLKNFRLKTILNIKVYMKICINLITKD